MIELKVSFIQHVFVMKTEKIELNSSQCAKDCGPHKQTLNHTHIPVFTPAQLVF